MDIKISPILDTFLQERDNQKEEGEDLLYTAEEISAFQDLINFHRTK